MKIKNILQEINYYYKLGGLSRPLKKFLLWQTPLSKLVNGPFYNKIYLKRIKKRAKIITPKILQIETTNGCNAKCLMCPHSVMKRKVKTMNLENFKKILDNVMKNYKIKRLTINGFGEPMLDPGLMDKIDYTNNKYPKLKVDIYTNGRLLTKEKTEDLLKKDLGRVTFSINGTQETYQEVMGLDYKETMKNVLYFLKRKKELKRPVLTNVSMMILNENKDKAKNFIDFWKRYSDSVRAYYPTDWAGSLREEIGLREIPYGERNQWPCSALWTHIVIHSNGEFVICCRDYDSKVQFGNLIKGDDIKKLRESPEFKKLKQQHLNFNFSSPICKTCDHSLDSSSEWWLW